MKIKIVIKTTNKNKKRVKNCVSTWLKNLDYVCMTDRISGLFKEEISCSKKEDYDSAEEKICNFLNKVREGLYSNFDWLFFIDDDAILNYSNLKSKLENLDKNKVYGYDMIRAWPEDLSLSFPSGGAGYLISPCLIRSSSSIEKINVGAEDVRLGIWMKENEIKLEHSLDLWPWFPLISVSYYDFKDAEKTSSFAVESLFDKFKQEDLNFIKSKTTLHYIRGEQTMKGFFNIMKQNLN